MQSIRFYLIIVLLSTICLVNFAAALNGYQSSTATSEQSLDRSLVDMAQAIAKISLNNMQIPSDTFAEHTIFQVWQNGQLLSRSNNAPTTLLASDGYHVVNAKGAQWRAFTFSDKATARQVVYGERYDLYRKLSDKVILSSILPIIWVLPIIALLVWRIVGWGIKPLESFAEMLKSRGVNDLKPIHGDSFPRELTPVVDSTNKLFARVSAAFEREQQFAADAAHELRTPLAALKVNLHNLAHQHDLDDELFIALKDSAKRMENSIEQLLALYRLTPENFRHTLTPCQLKSLTREVIIENYNSLQAKNQTIELLGDDVELEGDVFALSVLIRNLLDNAIKYTPTEGQIRIEIQHYDSQTIRMTVEDSGPGIPEKFHGKVFERFYRIGQDRHNSGVIGTGLGLSIVKHVVKLHQGSIKVARSKPLGGLLVQLNLPRSQAPLANSEA